MCLFTLQSYSASVFGENFDFGVDEPILLTRQGIDCMMKSADDDCCQGQYWQMHSEGGLYYEKNDWISSLNRAHNNKKRPISPIFFARVDQKAKKIIYSIVTEQDSHLPTCKKDRKRSKYCRRTPRSNRICERRQTDDAVLNIYGCKLAYKDESV